jgi:hypothetical protein
VPRLSTNLVLVIGTTEGTIMMLYGYGNPALDAELAYRRELAMLAGKGTRSPRPHRRWLRRSR